MKKSPFTKGFTLIELLMEHTNGAYSVGSWNLDDIVGGQVLDNSGSNNNGNVTGGVTLALASTDRTNVPFPSMKASLKFDGTGYISIPYKSSMNFIFTSAYTLMAWVKPAAFSQKMYIMGQVLPYLSIDTTKKIVFGVSATGNDVTHLLSGVSTLSQDKWYMVAGSYDNGSMKVYLDGKLEGQMTIPSAYSYSNLPFALGSYYEGSSRFTGNIAYARFYNMALSTAEIQKMYAEESEKNLLSLK